MSSRAAEARYDPRRAATVADGSPLVPIALDVVQQIRTDSELKELWDEGEDPAKWYATLDDLTRRLKACR